MAEWTALGDRAIRFPRPARPSAHALVTHLRAWPDVIDVVVAKDDIAVYFAGSPRVGSGAIARLSELPAHEMSGRLVELPAAYDGPDLDTTAEACGLTPDALVALHAGATYDVAMIGFAPGFAYLTGLDPRLHVARRPTPRPRVPAGSIALAGGYTGVYPFDSPGGWCLIGHVVGVSMFDERGSRLQLGDRVRFVR